MSCCSAQSLNAIIRANWELLELVEGRVAFVQVVIKPYNSLPWEKESEFSEI